MLMYYCISVFVFMYLYCKLTFTNCKIKCIVKNIVKQAINAFLRFQDNYFNTFPIMYEILAKWQNMLHNHTNFKQY